MTGVATGKARLSHGVPVHKLRGKAVNGRRGRGQDSTLGGPGPTDETALKGRDVISDLRKTSRLLVK